MPEMEVEKIAYSSGSSLFQKELGIRNQGTRLDITLHGCLMNCIGCRGPHRETKTLDSEELFTKWLMNTDLAHLNIQGELALHHHLLLPWFQRLDPSTVIETATTGIGRLKDLEEILQHVAILNILVRENVPTMNGHEQPRCELLQDLTELRCRFPGLKIKVRCLHQDSHSGVKLHNIIIREIPNGLTRQMITVANHSINQAPGKDGFYVNTPGRVEDWCREKGITFAFGNSSADEPHFVLSGGRAIAHA